MVHFSNEMWQPKCTLGRGMSWHVTTALLSGNILSQHAGGSQIKSQPDQT